MLGCSARQSWQAGWIDGIVRRSGQCLNNTNCFVPTVNVLTVTMQRIKLSDYASKILCLPHPWIIGLSWWMNVRTCASAYRMLRAIVGPQHQDDLYFSGDSRQRIYHDQTSLSQCSIVVNNRFTMLKLNYRTKSEIYDSPEQSTFFGNGPLNIVVEWIQIYNI